MKLKTLFCSAAAFAILALPVAQAAENDDPGGCRADMQKYCKDVKPGGGRMMQCMKEHEADLSAECRGRIVEGRKRMEAFSEACKADAETLCKGIEPGQGRIMRCMLDNKDKLSPACREKMDQVGKRHPCAEDAARLCAGSEPGKGRVGDCLKAHESELSAECKAQMQKHRRGAQDGGKQ